MAQNISGNGSPMQPRSNPGTGNKSMPPCQPGHFTGDSKGNVSKKITTSPPVKNPPPAK